MTSAKRESRVLGYLSLFSSTGTLLCCALPSLFVFFGFGATVASTLSAVPWLVAMSAHKTWVFAVAATLIAFNFYYVYRVAPRLIVARGVCAADDPEACARATRGSRIVLWLSTLLIAIGFSVAYVLPAILERIDA
jgi:hypothetical protein